MEDCFVLESDNCRFGGKMNEERLQMRNSLGTDVPMRNSLGSAVRKRLSDITNLRQQQLSPMRPISCSTKEYIEQLQKENMALLRLLAERNKIVELTGAELTKMRINLQKVQQQNWHLAQANSQMLAEHTLGKDKLKAMQHELGCVSALLAARNLELQEKVKKKPCPKCCTEEYAMKSEKVIGEVSDDIGDNKICKTNKKRQSRMPSSTVTERVAAKENVEAKRLPARIKSEQHEPANKKTDSKDVPINEKAESKRLCVRRQTPRSSSEQVEPIEDLFEIEDAKFPIDPLLEENRQDCSTSSTKEEEKKGRTALKSETPAPRRSSIGRPMRRAAEKVQCYKEVPLNVKMRREE